MQFAAAIRTTPDVTDRKNLDLANYLPYLVNRVGAIFVERFTRDALDRYHLSIAMWRVLLVLAPDEDLRQIDISARTSIDVSTLSRLVARLVRMSLVTRQRSAASSREVVVALAPKGRALVTGLIPMARKLEQAAVAGVPPREVAALKRLLRDVYEIMARADVSR